MIVTLSKVNSNLRAVKEFGEEFLDKLLRAEFVAARGKIVGGLIIIGLHLSSPRTTSLRQV